MQPDATQVVRRENFCDKFPFRSGDQGGTSLASGPSMLQKKEYCPHKFGARLTHPRPSRVLGFPKLVPITYLTRSSHHTHRYGREASANGRRSHGR
ncbi:hypothetical protein MesoLjLc_69450 [Mesorhizobium sp. L-8-10]|nr:hypothetical protein MesoLjLc_69450 [Mesorhizobium sp. L-8-10]